MKIAVLAGAVAAALAVSTAHATVRIKAIEVNRTARMLFSSRCFLRVLLAAIVNPLPVAGQKRGKTELNSPYLAQPTKCWTKLRNCNLLVSDVTARASIME